MSRLAMIFFALRPSYPSCLSMINPGKLPPIKPAHQQERENDTPDKQPFCDVERNDNTAISGVWVTTLLDLIGPILGGQHCGGSEDVRHVDQKRFEHEPVEKEVPGIWFRFRLERIYAFLPRPDCKGSRMEFSDIDKVELRSIRKIAIDTIIYAPCGPGRLPSSRLDHRTSCCWSTGLDSNVEGFQGLRRVPSDLRTG